MTLETKRRYADCHSHEMDTNYLYELEKLN